jgi:hypothetical protein
MASWKKKTIEVQIYHEYSLKSSSMDESYGISIEKEKRAKNLVGNVL